MVHCFGFLWPYKKPRAAATGVGWVRIHPPMMLNCGTLSARQALYFCGFPHRTYPRLAFVFLEPVKAKRGETVLTRQGLIPAVLRGLFALSAPNLTLAIGGTRFCVSFHAARQTWLQRWDLNPRLSGYEPDVLGL